jgi:hypothetical protein
VEDPVGRKIPDDDLGKRDSTGLGDMQEYKDGLAHLLGLIPFHGARTSGAIRYNERQASKSSTAVDSRGNAVSPQRVVGSRRFNPVSGPFMLKPEPSFIQRRFPEETRGELMTPARPGDMILDSSRIDRKETAS